MPGASLSREAIRRLAEDIHAAHAPKSVIAILQNYELEVMERLQPENLHPDDAREIFACMPLRDIFLSVRRRMWHSVTLPDTFPEILRSRTEEMSERFQSDIGIVTENNADIHEIQEWITTRIQHTLISIDRRGWLDGPASMHMLSASDVPVELLEILRQEKQ